MGTFPPAPPDPTPTDLRSRRRQPDRQIRSGDRLPVFLTVICVWRNLSKSLIPHSDCPFVLNRLPVFLENLPVSREKTDVDRPECQIVGLDGGKRHRVLEIVLVEIGLAERAFLRLLLAVAAVQRLGRKR